MGLRNRQSAPAPDRLDPAAEWRLRQNFLATLGAHLMGSPHPGAIGQGLAAATEGNLRGRQEALAARTEERERQLAETYRQEQIANMRADRQRADAEVQVAREQQRLGLLSRAQLLEELGRVSPGDVPIFEADTSAKAGDIRARILDVRKAQAAAAEPDEVNAQLIEQNGRYFAVNPRSLEVRPLGGVPAEVKERTPPKPYEEPVLTPYQVENMVAGRVQAGLATDAKDALRQIQRDTPASVLPPSYRPSPPPPPAATPPSPGRRMSIGASAVAAPADAVTIRGKSIPLAELVAEARAENSPDVARRTLGAMGLPAGTVELIVKRAYPVAAR